MASIGTIERMEALKDECDNQVITDGSHVWGDLRTSLEAAVAYQKAKQDAALKKAYS